MKPLEIYQLPRNSILDVYGIRSAIDMEPQYQRQGDVWELPKRQLLVDSILNEFDIPKFYFHNTQDFEDQGGAERRYKYAVIDGKQRLESIWKFMDDQYPLADDFELYEDSTVKASGLRYSELASRYPRLQARLEAFKLPIYVVRTDDVEMIEEMFSRLNEAVPLNAPEKRNSRGGPLPPKIKQVAQHEFFRTRLPFANNRYRHLDLAAKFLYVEYKGGATDTKKKDLDQFVESFRREGRTQEAEQLYEEVRMVVERMSTVFLHRDVLLKSVGMVVVYYLVFREFGRNPDGMRLLRRARFVEFEELRQQNRVFYREAQERQVQETLPVLEPQRRIDATLLEFDRLMQSPNDKGALELRSTVLRDFLMKK